MIEPPFVPGQFVWCRFPYSEAPSSPGDKQRIVYVADIRQHAGRRVLTVMSLYTTTAQWPPSASISLGIIPVAESAAARMSPQPFVIDARRIAFLPATEDFFPLIRTPDRGIVHEATKGLRNHIHNVLAQLARRPDLVQTLGPHAPGRSRPK